MDKKQLLEQLEIQREAFLDVIENVDDELLVKPGVCGDWSIKDILSHLSHWEAELVRLLWQIQQGQKPTTAQIEFQGKVDEINSNWAKEALSRPLDKVLDDYHAVRNQTINRVEEFSDNDLENPNRYSWLKGKPLSDWIENDSFGHELEHVSEIKQWLDFNSKQVDK